MIKDIGQEIHATPAFYPRFVSGEAEEFGVVIDRKGFEGCVLQVQVGAASGSPTRIGAGLVVYTCATSTGAFAAISGGTGSISGEPASVNNTDTEINLSLLAAERYIKLGITPQFIDGSTPAFPISAVCILGEARAVPV